MNELQRLAEEWRGEADAEDADRKGRYHGSGARAKRECAAELEAALAAMEPVAWYVERVAPGCADHGTKFGLTMNRDEAERSMDAHHFVRCLYPYTAPASAPRDAVVAAATRPSASEAEEAVKARIQVLELALRKIVSGADDDYDGLTYAEIRDVAALALDAGDAMLSPEDLETIEPFVRFVISKRRLEQSGEVRFFVDHGVVHDRLTGKHLGDPSADADYPHGLCNLLNDLAARALRAQGVVVTEAMVERGAFAVFAAEPKRYYHTTRIKREEWNRADEAKRNKYRDPVRAALTAALSIG